MFAIMYIPFFGYRRFRFCETVKLKLRHLLTFKVCWKIWLHICYDDNVDKIISFVYAESLYSFMHVYTFCKTTHTYMQQSIMLLLSLSRCVHCPTTKWIIQITRALFSFQKFSNRYFMQIVKHFKNAFVLCCLIQFQSFPLAIFLLVFIGYLP